MKPILSIGRSFAKADFEKIMGKSPRNSYKEERIRLNSIEKKAVDVIKEMPDFNFKEFEKRFFIKSSHNNNVYHYFEVYINDLNNEGRIGTSLSYNNSLQTFAISYYVRSTAKSNRQSLAPKNLILYFNNSVTSAGINRCNFVLS